MENPDSRPRGYSNEDVEFALRQAGLNESADLVVLLAKVRDKSVKQSGTNPVGVFFSHVDRSLQEVVHTIAGLERRIARLERQVGEHPVD
ncbi:hypothetical protein F6I18_10705 [Corynebacterium amycolatum]|uniref:hypothetical protein n=1 Tax=Corynebacterium TaxID=1716 RepID=UPI0012B6D03C|nr:MULTISPECIES: hypothetical protein [Corynebacterium]KAA9267399.1 hypothetical protein F6I18_10705 [Corynebacterium amycolatum]MBU5625273.1 hypothetical protein [Corynebacterium amycolatum]